MAKESEDLMGLSGCIMRVRLYLIKNTIRANTVFDKDFMIILELENVSSFPSPIPRMTNEAIVLGSFHIKPPHITCMEISDRAIDKDQIISPPRPSSTDQFPRAFLRRTAKKSPRIPAA